MGLHSLKNSLIDKTSDTLGAVVSWSKTGSRLANVLLAEHLDELAVVAEKEKREECATLKQALEHPLFIKWLSLGLANAVKRVDKKESIYTNPDFWQETYLPWLSSDQKTYPLEHWQENQLLRGLKAIQRVVNSKNALIMLTHYLQRIFAQSDNEEVVRWTDSIFRSVLGSVDSRRVMYELKEAAFKKTTF